MDATTPPSESTTAPPQEAAEKPPAEEPKAKKGKARERKPLSAEQRRKATARQAISRQLEALVASGDVGAMERAAEALRGGGTSTPAPEPAATAAPASSAAPTTPAPLPGWPTAEATARAMPLAQMAVQAMTLAAGLAGVDLARPREVVPGQPPMVLTEMLVKDTAPVLALYSPDFLNTPVGVLACTVLTVASVVISEAVIAKAKAEQAGTKPARVPEGAGMAAPEVARA